MAKRSFVIALVVLLGSVGAAEAQNKSKRKQARIEVEKGRKAQAIGDYGKALTHYKKAYELVPHPELFYNFAQALRLKGDRKKALEYYDRYLTVLPNGRSAKQARRFADLLRSVVEAEEKKRLAREAEARSRDKAARDKAARDKAARDKAARDKAARDKVARTKAARDKDNGDEDGDEKEGDGEELAITKTPKKGRGMKIAGLVSVGVGAVLIGLGVKFGMDAKSISDELSEETTAPWTDEELARQDEGKSAQTKMFVFTGLGAAAVIAGGVVYVMGRKKAAASERSLSFSPVVTPGRVGFALSKAF